MSKLIPIYIETDGACSGNPGPGGWGCIVRQGGHAIEADGPNPDTTNNEMELQAIAEALDFLPRDVPCYVIIESDSEGCVNVEIGAGMRWKMDNYVNLKGNKVKNKEFIDRTTKRLQPLHTTFKKIKGHDGDQWNDMADDLAAMGRNEAASWPKCSFDVFLPNGVKIPFRTRSVRPFWTIGELFSRSQPERRQNPVPRGTQSIR
jgi:ribonuclease HI